MTQPGWSCPIVWKDRVFITTCIYPDGLTHKERLPIIAIPSKRAPDAVDRITDFYVKNRTKDEAFFAFVKRLRRNRFPDSQG